MKWYEVIPNGELGGKYVKVTLSGGSVVEGFLVDNESNMFLLSMPGNGKNDIEVLETHGPGMTTLRPGIDDVKLVWDMRNFDVVGFECMSILTDYVIVNADLFRVDELLDKDGRFSVPRKAVSLVLRPVERAVTPDRCGEYLDSFGETWFLVNKGDTKQWIRAKLGIPYRAYTEPEARVFDPFELVRAVEEESEGLK